MAWVTLNHPPLNILDLEMIRTLDASLARLEGLHELRVVVFQANGSAFSAGVAVQDHRADRVPDMLASFHGVFHRLRRLACPTVAVVDGPALGGGCELAMVCDWVIATSAARLGFPEITLGAFPPVAVAELSSRVGRARALQLILSGEEMLAEEARQVGLVDIVVLEPALEANVERIVGNLRGKSAAALRLAKKAFREAAGREFEESLARAEQVYLKDLLNTMDAQEGVDAFLQKRPPVWRHE